MVSTIFACSKAPTQDSCNNSNYVTSPTSYTSSITSSMTSEIAYWTLGAVGNAIQVVAFIPQIMHMYKTKSGKGMSIKAYSTWATSDIMLLIYAIHIQDWIFMILTGSFAFFTCWIVFLLIKFKKSQSLPS
ncbi:MAG: hypothetical protein ACD_51C00353G0002 [uncultured bacterium]|nr:MAG: hypothetical protein ACD_51C00353G0002 [uncultured bacterium]